MPISIKSRVIIIDLTKNDWFDKAINKAEYLLQKRFEPCEEALEMFDQNQTFKKMAKSYTSEDKDLMFYKTAESFYKL